MGTAMRVGPSLALSVLSKNLQYFRITLADRRFDRRYDVDTTSPVFKPSLGLTHHHVRFGTSYHPTPVPALRKVFSRLRIDHRKYHFVEYGAGKGRVVMWAAQFPFAKVIGVEYADQLCAIARRNVDRFTESGESRSCIEIVCIDAADFARPCAPCIFYFYNPFGDAVAKKVFDNIATRREATPCPDMVVWLPSTEVPDALLPQEYGFSVTQLFAVRDPWGAKRSLFILTATR